MTDKLTLRQAVKGGKLDQFVAEHEADAPGDEAAFNRLFGAMAGTSKEAPKASPPDCGDD